MRAVTFFLTGMGNEVVELTAAEMQRCEETVLKWSLTPTHIHTQFSKRQGRRWMLM